MKKINLLFLSIFISASLFSQTIADFENLSLAPDTFWNGADLSGGFSSGHAFFENVYDTAYWSGFAYSDVTNNTVPGDTNQYSAITGSGYNSSRNYAVAYDGGNTVLQLTDGAKGGLVNGFYVTNSTYAYFSMLNGDQFEHAFSDSDWLELTITGWYQGNPISDSVHYYLAGFDTADSTEYIVNTWQWVSLRPLGNVDSLIFSLSGSQNDTFGGIAYLNTPAYFCMDNFTTGDIANAFITISYEQDTLVDVFQYYGDSSSGGPFTVNIIGGPNNVGASAVVTANNDIWYLPTISIVDTDTITYSICNTSGQCETAQLFFNITAPTAITQVNQEQSNIYPNPFNSSFAVYHSGDAKEVRLYDIEGQLIETIACNRGDNVTQVYAGNLAAGAYMVRLISDEGTTVTKIIKQ